MATRTFVREKLVSLLYSMDVGNDNIDLIEELESHKIKNKQLEFALKIYEHLVEHQEEIDEIIKSHITNEHLEDVGYMELAILRLGVSELQTKETEKAVVINEAIELTKKFCKDSSPKMVNAILDKIEVA